MKKITMLSVVLIMLAALIVFGGVAKAEANDHSDTALAFLKEAENDVAASEVLPELTEFSELSGKTVSMLTGATTGSVQIQQLEERFPNAELFYFTSSVDLLNALRANKIDAYAEPEPIVKYMMLENPDLTYLDERLGDGMQLAAIFPKTKEGQALCDRFNTYIQEIRQNGVYEEILETWFEADESKRVVPDLDTLPAMNGTLRMATVWRWCQWISPGL